MTVDEVLRALPAAFPAFNAKALEGWAPVYRAHLTRHEGPALRDAHVAVMGSFKPSGRTPFPVPAEFSAHLPSASLKLPDDGPKLDLEGHRRRKNGLIDEWRSRQGNAIRKARGDAIFARCLWEVQAIAQMRAWSDPTESIVLSLEKIQLCEDRAVSGARMACYGARPLKFGDGSDWARQMAEVRAALYANEKLKPVSEEPGELKTSPAMEAANKRLAELANARRQGKPAPPPRQQEVTA